MSRLRFRIFSLALIAASLLFTARPSRAQFDLGQIGPSKGQIIGVAAGAIAAVTVIGVVIYFAVRQPRVTGCVTSGPDGGLILQGRGSSDPLYTLQNAPATLQAGQRVKVFGYKTKDASKVRTFNIARVDKVYGACSPPSLPVHALVNLPTDELAVAAP